MKKIIYLLSILLISILYTPLLSVELIEVGDWITVYATDQSQTDLISNQTQGQQGGMMMGGGGMGQFDGHTFYVTDSGKAFIINVGILEVANKTTDDVEKIIKKYFERYFKSVQVSVLIQSRKQNRIYILGEVNNPGLHQVPKHDPYATRIANLLQMAGGVTPLGDYRNILVLRDGQEVARINSYEMVEECAITQNIPLLDGDTIIVKRKHTNSVYVLGQVAKPGSVPYKEGYSYVDYLLEAGGTTEEANPGNVGLIRREGDKLNIIHVDSDVLDKKTIFAQCEIKEGDIIFVPKHFFSGWRDVISVLGLLNSTIYIYHTVIK